MILPLFIFLIIYAIHLHMRAINRLYQKVMRKGLYMLLYKGEYASHIIVKFVIFCDFSLSHPSFL